MSCDVRHRSTDSEELWSQCNAILTGRRNPVNRPAKKVVHLFAGLAFCHCGEKMYVPSNAPKYTCLKCRNKIPATDLEGVFQEQLHNLFLSPSDITGYLEQADNILAEKGTLLAALERERQKLKAEMDQTYRLYLDGNLSSDGFGIRNGPLEERRRQIDDQIPELQGQIDFLKIQYQSSGEIISEAKDLYARWPQLQPAEKRDLVEAITEKIVIGKGEVEIDLCYAPPIPQIAANGQRNVRDSSLRPA